MPLKTLRASITFHIGDLYTGETLTPSEKEELEKFIINALSTYGGSRPPEDWLFHSLENVTVKIQ